jgi:hypothetical protein
MATCAPRRPTAAAGLRSPRARRSAEPKLAHVVFTRTASGQERLFVNGVERARASVPEPSRAGTIAFHLYLGNESHDERPWAGTYHMVGIYSQALTPAEVIRNFKVGAE